MARLLRPPWVVFSILRTVSGHRIPWAMRSEHELGPPNKVPPPPLRDEEGDSPRRPHSSSSMWGPTMQMLVRMDPKELLLLPLLLPLLLVFWLWHLWFWMLPGSEPSSCCTSGIHVRWCTGWLAVLLLPRGLWMILEFCSRPDEDARMQRKNPIVIEWRTVE